MENEDRDQTVGRWDARYGYYERLLGSALLAGVLHFVVYCLLKRFVE